MFFQKKLVLNLRDIPKVYTFAPLLTRRWNNGFLAQLVEQWIENPCVPGSIPGETTEKPDFFGLFSFLPGIIFLLIFAPKSKIKR